MANTDKRVKLKLDYAVGTSSQYIKGDGTLGSLNDLLNTGGLTSGTNTSTPNTTIGVQSISAVNALTNMDLALLPKGSGAFMLNIPDNTIASGGKRGVYSVDLQRARAVSTQVSSGNYSVIGGGQSNKASDTLAVISGGTSNVASGTQSSIGGGGFNSASGTYSSIPGGSGNFASGSGSTAHGLASNAKYYGCRTHNGSGAFAAAGDCQNVTVSLRGTTTNNTETILYLDGTATGTVTNRLVMNANSTWYLTGRIVARSATGSSKVFTIKESSVSRAASLASIALGTITVLGQDAIMGTTGTPATWLVGVGVDTVNGALTIKVTGDTDTAVIRWYAYLDIVEVTH